MTIHQAATPAELIAALKIAAPGDEVALARTPEPWPAFKLTGIKRGGVVTIRSADPKARAALSGVAVSLCAGLSFTDLECIVSTSNGFSATDCQDVHWTRLWVHGSLDGDPTNDTSAMQLRRCTGVSVTHSEFEQIANGVSHLDCDDLLIHANSFHDLQIDGVRGGGSSKVTITGNVFTDFFRPDGAHPDAIQFWTSNTTASEVSIVIAGNVILRGKGGPMQGVFMKDESNGLLPYIGVDIFDNFIAGSMWNGISVSGSKTIRIRANLVAGFADMKARISLKNVSDVTLIDNIATDYTRTQPVQITAESNNTRIPCPEDGGLALLADWVKGRVGVHPAALALVAPTEPPAPVDPKDAEITALQAQVVGLTDELATAADKAVEQAGLLTAANDQIALAGSDLDSERGKVAALREVLGAISKTAAEAASP